MSSRSLKPLERQPVLVEQVYDALRLQLRNGGVRPGQALQEVRIAEQLGVSRTPVREAMARLASEGLLATDRRSFTVPALTLADVDDIYELRCLIEPAALRRVAQLAGDATLRQDIDRALVDAAGAHRAGDSQAFQDANVRYRAAWLALVPNQRWVRMIELYADHMQHIRAVTLGSSSVRTIVLRGLKRITAALSTGDGDAAAAAMHEHLLQARHAFIRAVGLDGQAAVQRRSKGS
ncbi:MAG: GntR family transcriptional regulator [Rubrivivax sp.]|nr:GntR family transcriptional regulator [Rubrivivax sp.]